MNLLSRRMILEWQSFSRKECLFIFFAMCIGFLIAFEYSITRPASHALFLTTFSSSMLPFLWVATVPINFLGISFYNYLLSRLGPLKVWGLVSFTVVLVNSVAAYCLFFMPKFIFVQCICKDIYILLMFKQMWSLIHATLSSSSKVKYLYGLIFSMGTVGSCVGSFIPSRFAVQLGSESFFYFTLPIYLVMGLIYRAFFKKKLIAEDTLNRELVKGPPMREGFGVIMQNRMLLVTLFLVVAMQISSGLMEYRFNVHLEMQILDKDLRTAYYGKLFALTNGLSLFLQAIGSFFIIQLMGLKRVHFLIPLMLLGSLVFTWIMPSFLMLSFSYVFLKAIDFSLFSISREMLYIPLNLVDKFRAKAVIDVFAYRSSKAVISVAILGLQLIAERYVLNVTQFFSILLFLVWMGVVYFLLKDPDPLSVS